MLASVQALPLPARIRGLSCLKLLVNNGGACQAPCRDLTVGLGPLCACASLTPRGVLQLPASFFAYRKQQHRWTCGPVQLWFKASRDIWASKLPLHRKLELILLYFGVRKFATHWVSLGFFCTLVPLSIFTPEVRPCFGAALGGSAGSAVVCGAWLGPSHQC